MSQDAVSADELRHDMESSKRLAEQDRLEAEFRRDPVWDLVAECLTKRETVGDIVAFVYAGGASHMDTARAVIALAIEQCAREYAEREGGK